MERRSRQDKPILLPGRFFVRSKILPCLDMRRCYQTVDALALHQPVEQFSDCAAGWIYRCHAAAETVHYARYIDTAPAGISLWRRTTQFSSRFNAPDIDKNIYRWVDRESDDIRHLSTPFSE